MSISLKRTGAVAWVAALAILLAPAAASAQSDIVLFSTNVQPNVLLILDNSFSMEEIVWHPMFDPDAVYACTDYDPDELVLFTNDTTMDKCGKTRTIYTDNKITGQTRYRGKYLNWLFSPASDTYDAEISAGSNGTPSSCTGGANFAKYQRTKITAAKRAIQEIVCEVNLTADVKFGFMIFRSPDDEDPNGGFVLEPVEEYNSGQAADLVSSLQSIRSDSNSPMGEAMFQAYTYFMSRDPAEMPLGDDGVTLFPPYEYDVNTSGTGGSYTTNTLKIPESPVEYSCQKNFVIIVTDGSPTYDDFVTETPTDTTAGFANFSKLIGNYVSDAETEEPADDVQSAFYLDDIAHYMQQNDFCPKLDEDQTIDVYTIGFTAEDAAENLLERTARLGNGLFFPTTNAEEMAQAIVDAFADIIEKAQSFTAATVPATRTSFGENLYVSLFIPTEKTSYWEGHLKSFTITGAGEILDKFGNCALDDPTGACFSGPFKPTAVPHWDAYDKIPAPASRNLSTSKLSAGIAGTVPFDSTLAATDLDVVYPPVEVYTGSTALNADGLKDEIIASVRGCNLGTGVLTADVSAPLACDPRAAVQGDIFHANPVLVGPPSLFDGDPSFDQFAYTYRHRTRVIMAGSNGGFFQGYHAGVYDGAATPPGYTSGTGVELFGFMPWPSRQTIRHKPIDSGNRDYYYVDGSPSVSDVWLYTGATTAAKLANGSEWRTVVLSGLRQGGPSYFALDITNPSDSGYPGYMWEFPAENAAVDVMKYFGQTWGTPVITKIKVQVNGNDNGGDGFERWVAIVTGGFDASGDPNNVASYDATATAGRAIAIVDLKTGQVIAYKAFDPLATGPEKDMLYSITSTPAVFDYDFDGFADAIWVGDLGGNMWKWVINAIGEDRVNDGGDPNDQPNWPFRIAFQAPVTTTVKATADHYKSFFVAPAATLIGGQLWMVFGSGERANPASKGLVDGNGDVIKSDVDNNRFYALKDDDPLEEASPVAAVATEGDMKDLTSTTSCDNVAGYRGYYFVGAEGEKFVTAVEIFLGYVFVGTFVPTEPTDPCSLGGDSYLYVFRTECGEGYFPDVGSGKERTISLGAGMPTDPRITVGNDGDSSNRVIVNKQGGEIVNFPTPPGFSSHGMLYWMEGEQ